LTTERNAGLVLVLEDDRRSAEALAMLIEDWGYECVHGAEFAELLPTVTARAGEVCAIISDFHLQSGTTGIEAIAKASEAGLRAPVLLLTGTLHGEARRAATAAGHRFMEKPVLPERVRAWLKQVAVDEAG
jgi:DNA-binding NtrC family response regulator